MSTVLSWAIKEDDFGNSPKDRTDEREIRSQEKIRYVNAAVWQNAVESRVRIYLPNQTLRGERPWTIRAMILSLAFLTSKTGMTTRLTS